VGEASGVNKVFPGGSGRGLRWRPRARACRACRARFVLTRSSFLTDACRQAAAASLAGNAVAVGQVTDHDSGIRRSTRTPLSWQHRRPHAGIERVYQPMNRRKALENSDGSSQ
jgi:hypothetical protein